MTNKLEQLAKTISEAVEEGQELVRLNEAGPTIDPATGMIPVKTAGELKKVVKAEIKRLGNDADLNHIDTSKVKNMNRVFFKSKFNGDISKWDTSNVTEMSETFAKSSFNGDISKWDVGKVNIFNGTFGDSVFNGDISKWNTKSAYYTGKMF